MPVRLFLHNNPVIYGVLLALIQTLFFACVGLFVKLASETHHTVDIVFARNITIFILISVILIWQGRMHIVKKADKKKQLLRGCVGTITMFFYFMTISYLPLSQAQVLIFGAPLFVVILSYPVLKEKVGQVKALATITGFAGIIFVLQPDIIVSYIGAVYGILAAIGQAAVYILLRLLGRSEDPLVTVFYFGAIGSLIVLPVLPFTFTLPTLETAFYLLMVGLSACILQIAMTKAYTMAPASVLAPITYTGLIWMILFDIWIWGYVPDAGLLVGAAIIIGANIVIVLREQRQAKETIPPKI